MLGLAIGLMLASCGGADSVSRIELSNDQIDSIYANAVNNNGWQDVSPDIWAALAVEACDRGAWEHETNAEIVSEFLSEHGWIDRAQADRMPLIVWLNIHVACFDLIPEDATPPPGALG